jgi:hypothetical protein
VAVLDLDYGLHECRFVEMVRSNFGIVPNAAEKVVLVHSCCLFWIDDGMGNQFGHDGAPSQKRIPERMCVSRSGLVVVAKEWAELKNCTINRNAVCLFKFSG